MISSGSFLKLLMFLSPFLSAWLVYFFGIKGKQKDTDFQKEKELNVVLSNLLIVWSHLATIETSIEILKNDHSDSIVPKKYFPILLLKTGYIKENSFDELDKSIEVLKKYDPILFFELDGIGNALDTIRTKLIMPLLESSEMFPNVLNLNVHKLLIEKMEELERTLKSVASKISKKTLEQTNFFINTHILSDVHSIITDMNEKYYELMSELMEKESGENISFDEFKELAKDEGFIKIIQLQFEIIKDDSLKEYLKIFTSDPNISLNDAQIEVNKNRVNK